MDINRRLQAEKEPELTDPKEIMQRVRNAKYNLLRYVKGLPNMTPKREPLIEAVRGKGMIFRNPEQ